MEKRGKGENGMRDQRGFTLVELLIGIVILSIVTAAVCSFIIVGSKSYAAANTEIMLQQEAQLALNQISDVLIDTTRSVNYAGYAEDGTPILAVKDADFTFEPSDKSLTMFNGAGTIKLDADGKPVQATNPDGSLKVDGDGNPVYETDIESGSGNDKNYQFYWNKDDAKLYYSEIDVSQTDFPQNAAEGQVVLAEYVTEFSVDLTQVEEKRVVQISMTFERDNKTYHTSNNITIRNKVRINDVDLGQLDKRVKLSVTPKENSVILEPGETYHFSTPLVSGQNVMDKSVTWALSDEALPLDSATQFGDTANGIIQIASGETAESFKVIITTNAKDSEGKQATAEVIVYVKRAETVALSLDGGSKEITAGTTFKINASVEGSKLGYSCGGCADPTTEDKYVIADEYPAYGWQILSGEEYVELVSSDNKSATFKISANAKDGDEVVIQAASLLSARKSYTKNGGSGIVYGTITLTVKENEKIHIDWEGDLVYGGSNILNMVTINSDDPVFFVCVRVKKNPNAPIEDDMVMIYTTEGNNARIKPDTWLLDMNQEYVISVQVINVLSDPSLRDENMQKTERYYELRRMLSAWSGSKDSAAYAYLQNYVNTTFWPEYTANLHGTTGGYQGEKYSEYSNLVPGVVEVPRIGIQSYLDGYNTHFEGIDAKTVYTVQKNAPFLPCPFGEITSTWGSAVFQNFAYYNVYRGNSDDASQWERLYYLPEDEFWPLRKEPGLYQGIGNLNGILLFDQSQLTNRTNVGAKMNFSNNSQNWNNYNYDAKKAVVGTYHFVPAMAYVNQPEGVYLKISDNYEIHDGKQYCYDYTSTFNFEVEDGGNLTLWTNTNDGFKKGEIFFPVPSDPVQFPGEFRNLGAEEKSIYNYDGTYLLDKDGKLHEPKFSEVKCRYDAAQNRYELKLYYDYTDSGWGVSKRCCAGTFICEPDGNEWRLFNKGDYDEQFEAGKFDSIQIDGSNVSFVLNDNNGNPQNIKAYIPVPSDSKFTQEWNMGFVLEQEGTQEKIYKNGYEFVYQKIGSTNFERGKWYKISCTYDKNTDSYTLELTTAEGWDWNNDTMWGRTDTIRLTCKSTDTKWTVVK